MSTQEIHRKCATEVLYRRVITLETLRGMEEDLMMMMMIVLI